MIRWSQNPHFYHIQRTYNAYNISSPLPVEGYVLTSITANGQTKSLQCLLIKNAETIILGHHTAVALDLLRVGPPKTANHVQTLTLDKNNALNILLDRYKDRFTGLGQLKDVTVKIHVDDTVTPVVQKPRRLPILLQQQVDVEIDHLIKLNVLEQVTKPPTWVNPLIVVPKKIGIRLCVDMRMANTAIIREPYQIPTLEEILHEFNGCKYFTTLDFNQGYHQITLAEESRDLTAFASRKGILRYTRLIYGISPASEIYQREIELMLSGLDRVKNISDDIIIGAESIEELLKRMESTLERLRQQHHD